MENKVCHKRAKGFEIIHTIQNRFLPSAFIAAGLLIPNTAIPAYTINYLYDVIYIGLFQYIKGYTPTGVNFGFHQQQS